jgi:hypothetical protein
MIRRTLMSAAFAAVAGVIATASPMAISPAAAQVGVEFQFGSPRYERPYYGRPNYGYERRQGYRPVYGARRIIQDDDDCRIIVQRRINRFGEMVMRRTRVCD